MHKNGYRDLRVPFFGHELFLTFPKASWKLCSQSQSDCHKMPACLLSLEPYQLGAVTLIKGTNWQSSVLLMRKVDGKFVIA
jgi:hypothetical protein